MITAPRLSAEWARVRGAAPTDADIDQVYEVFVPMNEKVVADYATLVPGAGEAVEKLRGMGLKIGSTTGYTRSIMESVFPVCRFAGLCPGLLRLFRRSGRRAAGTIADVSVFHRPKGLACRVGGKGR